MDGHYKFEMMFYKKWFNAPGAWGIWSRREPWVELYGARNRRDIKWVGQSNEATSEKKTNLWRFRRILVGLVEGVEGSGGAAECCSYFVTGIAEAVCVPLSRGSASTRDRKLDCGMDFSFQQNYRAALSWSFSSHKHFFPFFFNLSPQSIVLNFDRTENNIDIYRIVYLINNVINNFI